jgi:hypothetical protein
VGKFCENLLSEWGRELGFLSHRKSLASSNQREALHSDGAGAEHWAGRAGYGCFALRANLVRSQIGAVRRRAGALIPGPLETNRIGVTLVCHGVVQQIAADAAFGLEPACFVRMIPNVFVVVRLITSLPL